MQEKKTSIMYKPLKWLVKLCSPKFQVEGQENLPDEPVLVVGNHSQMYGPLGCEFYFPGYHYTWCAGQMMHLKDVPAYAYQDFWSGKPKSVRWFYKIVSYLIAPLSVFVFNNANTIGVYRDSRIITTFKNTTKMLEAGANVIVFPECYDPHNHIVHQFQENFVDVAKLYYKRTGKAISFVPLYIAPRLKKMYIGKPVRYQPDADAAQERSRICNELMDQITDIACALPEHIVVPYPNISKKEYKTNRV